MSQFIFFVFFSMHYVIVLGQTDNRFKQANYSMINLYSSKNKNICLDTAFLRISYTEQYVEDSTLNLRYKDTRHLLIGRNYSKCGSYFCDLMDSITLQMKKKGIEDYAMNVKEEKDREKEIQTEYVKRFKDQMLIVKASFTSADYQYEEPIPIMNWEIGSKTITLLNYTCQEATLHFRGRDYTAWFSIEIPINQGPWKFNGLPGLILKVYDNQQLFVFEATAIEKVKQAIYTSNDYTKTNRSNLMKIDQYRHTDPIGYLISVTNRPQSEWGQRRPGEIKLQYIPMELE